MWEYKTIHCKTFQNSVLITELFKQALREINVLLSFHFWLLPTHTHMCANKSIHTDTQRYLGIYKCVWECVYVCMWLNKKIRELHYNLNKLSYDWLYDFKMGSKLTCLKGIQQNYLIEWNINHCKFIFLYDLH